MMEDLRVLEDLRIPGRRLNRDLADRLQRCFVQRFAPEVLPRLSPPLWGEKFENAELVDCVYLKTAAFQRYKHVLCLVGRLLRKPAKKYQRDIFMCRTKEIADFLCSLHWGVGCDFYIFDANYRWFIAALEERIYQMNEDGIYKLLYYSEPDANLSSPVQT
jgi:hypothetical protein